MSFLDSEISVEFLGAFKIKRGEFSHKSFNNRAYDSIGMRLKGNGEFISKNSCTKVNEGSIVYIPKNADYTQKTKGETVIAVHFINYSDFKPKNIECLTVDDTRYAAELFNQMYDIWKEKKKGYRYLCLSLFYELLYFMEHQNVSSKSTPLNYEAEISKAMDYIHSNYRNGNIKVSELSQMCSLSETYFRKIFKKFSGVSPQQYIMDLKLEFAFHLLGSNLYTVSEVAHKSGFEDTKYFSRVFKKKYSLSPKQAQLNSNFLLLERKNIDTNK